MLGKESLQWKVCERAWREACGRILFRIWINLGSTATDLMPKTFWWIQLLTWLFGLLILAAQHTSKQEGKELSKLRDIEQRLAPLVASLHLVHFIPEVPDIPQPALLSDVFCLRRRFHVQLGNRLDICMVTSTDDFILSQLITSRIHSSLMQSIWWLEIMIMIASDILSGLWIRLNSARRWCGCSWSCWLTRWTLMSKLPGHSQTSHLFSLENQRKLSEKHWKLYVVREV